MDDLFDDPDPATGGPDSSPGPWFTAGFDGECSRGCAGISEGEEARADGEGGWECRSCVEADGENSPWNVHGEDPYACM